ncbi:HvfX family Cu-binding RiPP maturation protein [Lysobacter solisilvae (ex Woo and Kim 2020)]|uniref:DoxX family protein n=1 Tax=Agrilutibacter terrestris TaxID=2865112 RepID=A0A7H0FXL2_9GAMM|nr:DoxX family protein [Lysobacter terrestris]QNP40778.1 DoxX family protein [Lysobacter terrestris]
MSTNTITAAHTALISRLERAGNWAAPVGLRAILAWEFFEAGWEKLHGDNWFADLADKFLFPFSLLSPNVNWAMATWIELVGAVAILIGFGTRYAAFALFLLTIVAIHAVHLPAHWSSFAELWQGYAITNQGFGNYKLPLLFLLMLAPLIFKGAGHLSLDYLISNARRNRGATPAA